MVNHVIYYLQTRRERYVFMDIMHFLTLLDASSYLFLISASMMTCVGLFKYSMTPCFFFRLCLKTKVTIKISNLKIYFT